MSTGKISKPINPKKSNEALTQLVTNLVYETVQTCEVHVDNSKLEGSLNRQLASIETKIQTITTKIGHTEGNIGKDIESIKAEVELIKARKPTEIAVSVNNAPYKTIGIQHFQFPQLLKILSTKLNVYMVGPAGSGKTTAAIHCAKALGVEFHFTGAVVTEWLLLKKQIKQWK
jgi:cobaltochelatase CobS